MPLQDSDNFIIGRGEIPYKITYQDLKDDLNYVPPPVGTINQPTVLEPNEGAGGGGARYLKTDAITKVEGGGIDTCETELIESVDKHDLPVSTSGTLFAGPVEKIFEEGTASEGEEYTNGTGSIWTRSPFTMTLNLTYTQKVELVATQVGGINGYSINDGPMTVGDFVTQAVDATSMQKREVLTGSGTLNNLTIYGTTGDQLILSQIWVDGVQVLNGATTLTFPTNQGFDCFEPGDVVQDGAESSTANWSSMLSGDLFAGRELNAFDGNLTTTFNTANTPGTTTFTPDEPIHVQNELTFVYFAWATSKFHINNVDYSNQLTRQNGSLAALRYSVSGPMTLTSASWQTVSANDSVGIFGIIVDGRILIDNQVIDERVYIISKDEDANTITVDGGEWYAPGDAPADQNRDQDWSSLIQGTIDTQYNSDTRSAFNGVIGTNYTDGIKPETGTGGLLIDFGPNGIPCNTLKINSFMALDSGGTQPVKVNGTEVIQPNAGGEAVEFDYTVPGGILYKYEWFYYSATGAGGYCYLLGLTADGKLLVDAGGDTKLTKTTFYDTKLTVDSDKDLAKMTGATFMSDGTGAPGPYTQTPYKLVTSDIESVASQTLSEYDQRFTWSDAANFDSVPSSGLYPFTNMFDGQSTGFNGAQTDGQASGGKIIWNAPSGANLSGSVWLCAGDNAVDASYSSPIVYINGSSTPAEQNSKTIAGVGFGFHIYEFKNSGPVTKVEIAPDPTTLPATIMSIGVGNSWLIDAGIDTSGVNTGVVPDDIVGSNTVLTFADPNPDLRYFEAGDVVQQTGDDSQTWSALPLGGTTTPNSSYPIANVYNGTTTQTGGGDTCYTQAAGNIVVSLAGLKASAPVEVGLFGTMTSATSGLLSINGVDKTPVAAGASGYTVSDSTLSNGTLTVSFANQSGTDFLALCYIKVGGVLLVDPGVPTNNASVVSVDPDNNTMIVDGGNWDLTKGAPYIGYKLVGNYEEADPVFDITTADESAQEEFGQRPSGNVSTGNNSGWLMFDCLQELAGLTFKYWGSDVPLKWRVQRSDDGVNWVDDHEKELDNIKESTSTSGIAARYWRMARFGASKENIMVYQNYGISDSFTVPQTLNVEYQTKGGKGTIVDINTDDNTLLIANTGDRDNRWIAENKAGTDFYVAGPSIIDSPLLTNDVDLRCSDFATTPLGVDTLKEIVWKINGTEYSANTTNPWKPLEKLPTNSIVTVAVKHIGNTLGESNYSSDVTFETGASMRSLFTRIAALEAGELIDDATDTALLTLLSNLAIRVQALEESN